MPQPAAANVDCYGSAPQQLPVSRSDITSETGGQQSFAIPGSKSSLIVNANVDLNIESDIDGFAHGMVTKQTNLIWQVDVYFENNSNDFITADYQFQNDQICSSPSSCIDVVDIRVLNSPRTPIFIFGFLRIGTTTVENIELTLDLSDAKDSGTYFGNLRVELFRGSDAAGGDGAPLNCDNL